MLTAVPGTFPAGLGEPLNAIITGDSDADLLMDNQVDGGLRNYFLSFGYSSECLGQHLGDDQGANLGDGHGYLNETAVIRWNYGDPQLGSCKETVEGGGHFRFWVQDGPDANSGAVFMAVSYEKPIAEQHDIVVNGYNLGRDWMIGNITQQQIPTLNLTNTSAYTGVTSWANYTYQTNISYVSGLLSNTSDGVNHFASVGINGMNAIDGLVAVMHVSIIGRPAASSGALRILPSLSLGHLFILVALAALSSLI